jgi:hypothetical protein
MARPAANPPMNGHKVCLTCGENKPVTRFRLRSPDSVTLRPHCRQCLNAKANNSPAGIAARLRWVLRTRYEMSTDDYEALLKGQDGKCAIYGGAPKAYGRLYVDHCHESGRVRGLLCNTCNAGLGQFNDDLDLLRKAVQYMTGGGV